MTRSAPTAPARRGDRLAAAVADRLLGRLGRRYAELSRRDPRLRAFQVELPGGPPRRFGGGEPAFRLRCHDARGLLALASLDEARIGEAFLAGHIDCEGSLLEALRLRPLFGDRHPWARLWSTRLQPLLFRQVRSDERWVAEHYDEDPVFFELFLGPSRCYSHGVFESADEPLEKAMARKFDFALEACRIRPGQRVLDIGGGWGAFTEYAGRLGVRVTSLTISEPSERSIAELIRREKLPCRVVRRHFLEYEDRPFDAIVNMGVTEHLPDYPASLARYARLLVPGGRVYLDASAGPAHKNSTSFIFKHVFPGNASTLCLHTYLEALAHTSLELVELRNDRESYMLTSLHWARNLERHREAIVSRWGERLYRKFRLFHWGCVYSFSTDQLSAYRWVLEKPAESRMNRRLSGSGF